MRFKDQVAVITGTSSGNGRAIALALAAQGARVVCSDLVRQAQDVAKAVAFLASDDAQWMTGSLLTVDGAFTAQ